MRNLEAVIQDIRNLAAADRRGVENNNQTIKTLLDRATELRGTNVWLEARAKDYDLAVATLESLNDQ